MSLKKQWVVADPIDPSIQQQHPELHPVLLQLLYSRGVQTQEEIDVFLGPDWSRDIHDAWEFSQMREAVDLVFGMLERGETIAVHGDYDADGVCGTTVLVSTLRDICEDKGFTSNIEYYIPHREKEGYGMSVETMEHLAGERQVKLVITVDCGISNKDAIDRGKELGVETIVCDHHTMPEVLPEAVLIHPLVPGEPYPNKFLCGTGVAFKLASALIDEARAKGASFPEGYDKWLLDLVAIATVTDVMKIVGENRILEKFGLLVLNKTRRIGLKKLIEVAGGELGALDTMSIGFMIGPRINAAGRMNHATQALELLLSTDEVEATEMAHRLQETNKERQKASKAMYEEALTMVGDAPTDRLLIVAKEGWSPGLVGLVAGKLLTKYSLPTFVVGQEGEKFVGSGRSLNGFDVTQALREASEYLDKFGGHPEACGFSTSGEERFAQAADCMRAFAQEALTDEMLAPTLKLDAEIQLEDVSWELQGLLEQMEPFGHGNRRPLFCARGVKIIGLNTVGKEGQHLRLTLQSPQGKIVQAIGFRFGDWVGKLALGNVIDVAFEVQVNEWNGNRSLQLRLEDLRVSEN